MMKMMKHSMTGVLLAAALLAASCSKSEIAPYALEDSAVIFNSPSVLFSLKGMSEDTRDLRIPVLLVGVPADYDREIAIEAVDSTAVLGRDYTILSKTLPAGAVRGEIVLRVNRLTGGVESRATRFTIVANEFFRAGPPKSASADIEWSEAYVRPQLEVWRYWYTYLCHGYSKEYHRLLVEYFGEEIEKVTNNQSYARADETLVYKLPSWWYNATREFRDFVRNHDQMNPGDPWRHSDDYEQYSGYGVARGSGFKPETLPTIFETLNVL